MSETQAILAAFNQSQENQEVVFLATVVNVQGSAYGQPGTRMLISQSGQVVGTVSGGCLENDVLAHITNGMVEDGPIVVTYDTSAQEDIIWGFGLGCNGVIRVLIEKLDRSEINPLEFIQNCQRSQNFGVMATVFAVTGMVDVKLGQRFCLTGDGRQNTNISDRYLRENVSKDAQKVLQQQKSATYKYCYPQGEIDIWFEYIAPPIQLVIFGAGGDVLPLLELAKYHAWDVTVVDCRANQESLTRFAIADQVILTRRTIIEAEISQHIQISDSTVAVVMTHNYLDDLEILQALLPLSLPYVGCLGSKQRCEKLLNEFKQKQNNYTNAKLEKLYAPIGIDIGANTPSMIALSIVAEIQAVLNKRTGGFLKHRHQPIHSRSQVEKITLNPSLSFHAQ